MNKKVIVAIMCVAVLLCIIGYNPPENIKTELPSGVRSVGEDNYCYIIKLPDGKSVSDYFTLVGGKGTVCVSETDVLSYDNYLGTVYYQSVSEGGWVGYGKSQTGCVVYIPSDFPENRVTHACSMLATNASNYMTIEEARAYIQWLKP